MEINTMIELKTYITHYKKLIHRKNFIENQFKNCFSNYEYYEDFDKNELTEEIIKNYYNPDPIIQTEKLKLWNNGKSGIVRILNLAEISVSIKHGKVIQKIAESFDDIAIIFEDDVILCENFVKKFNEYLKVTPSDFDVIFIGSGANLKSNEIKQDQFAYIKSHPASRCADSYVITKKAAKEISSTYFPFSICSDWELAYQMYKHNHKVYWWEPSLVKQGSEHGVFESELR